MGLIRFLAITFIIWLVIHLLRRVMFKPRPKPGGGQTMKIGTVVKCEVCGLHIPENEAVIDEGQYYCSTEHRDKSRTSA